MQRRVFHFAGILLLSGVLVGQLAGILRQGKIGKAIGHTMSGAPLMLADGPVPLPPNRPTRGAVPTAS